MHLARGHASILFSALACFATLGGEHFAIGWIASLLRQYWANPVFGSQSRRHLAIVNGIGLETLPLILDVSQRCKCRQCMRNLPTEYRSSYGTSNTSTIHIHIYCLEITARFCGWRVCRESQLLSKWSRNHQGEEQVGKVRQRAARMLVVRWCRKFGQGVKLSRPEE
jgi:hypothetical protein